MNNRAQESTLMVVRAPAPFGGMQRRYIRLAAHMMNQSTARKTLLLVGRSSCDYVKRVAGISGNMPVEVFETSKHQSLYEKIRAIVNCVKSINKAKCKNIFLASAPGPFTAVVALMFAFRARVSFCMVDYTIRPNASVLRRVTAAISCLFASRIDCLSPALKDDLVFLTWGIGSHKVRVAPCSFTDYSEVIPARARDIDVLFMSRFIPEKGLDLISEIGPNLTDLNIHVCGFGSLKFDARQFSVYESDNPFEQMGRAKIFLSLQKINNYPSQSVLEAMASGCAIIATDVGETRLFLDDECAVLIPYEANALKDAIRQLISDPEKMARLAENARHRAMEEHTIKRYSDYFIKEVVV